MNLGKKKFKVVIIDYPINILDDRSCSALLGNTLAIKHRGYKNTYGNNVLPMDKSDFFSTHIIFCEEIADQLIPITAYKSTRLDRCKFYDFEFPALTLMKNDGHDHCVEKIKDILMSVEDTSLISYDSSWAHNPDYQSRTDKYTKSFLKEIIMMFIVNHHIEYNIPHMFACGVVKVKTDQFFLKVGLKEVDTNAEFKQKNLNNTVVKMFHTTEFSFEARSIAKKHQQLWDEKLVIDGSRVSTSRIKAA